jgi:hypothetical protein
MHAARVTADMLHVAGSHTAASWEGSLILSGVVCLHLLPFVLFEGVKALWGTAESTLPNVEAVHDQGGAFARLIAHNLFGSGWALALLRRLRFVLLAACDATSDALKLHLLAWALVWVVCGCWVKRARGADAQCALVTAGVGQPDVEAVHDQQCANIRRAVIVATLFGSVRTRALLNRRFHRWLRWW